MQFQRIGVVGCGLMGHGIAQVAADAAELDVVVVESEQEALDRGLQRIERSLDKLYAKAVEKGALQQDAAAERLVAARDRLHPTTDFAELSGCDLVVEAIPEDLGLKRALFERLADTTPETTVLATNTSSFPVAECAEASGRPDRTIGLHWFNPVQLMKLVEVVRIDTTAPEVLEAARAFATACGKVPVTARDTPGFIVNRLLVPYMVQALLMLDRGDASAQDIDTAMQLGTGHPMGPVTLTDYVGLDTTLAILEGWVARHPDEPAFAIPASLRAHVAAGRLGRKSGQGYYRWDGDRRVD